MKRLTREERRRIQRRAANIRFLAFVLILLVLGVCIGYTAARAQNACDPSEPQEVSQPSPVDDMPQEPAEQPAEDYSSLDRLELIGTFTATAYCPCVKCCGIWSEDHPSRGEDYVQKTRAGTIPEEGRTIAADWDVLPKGSEVVINGHPYIVEDTGSAVKGNHVDIFFESHEAACEFGIQQVEVYQEAAGCSIVIQPSAGRMPFAHFTLLPGGPAQICRGASGRGLEPLSRRKGGKTYG